MEKATKAQDLIVHHSTTSSLQSKRMKQKDESKGERPANITKSPKGNPETAEKTPKVAAK